MNITIEKKSNILVIRIPYFIWRFCLLTLIALCLGSLIGAYAIIYRNKRLVASLSSTNISEYSEAFFTLERDGHWTDEQIAIVARGLNSDDQAVRDRTVFFLYEKYDRWEAFIPTVLAGLQSENPETRKACLAVLELISFKDLN